MSSFKVIGYIDPLSQTLLKGPLNPSVSLPSSVRFHLQPCSKGWDLHHSRWSSSSSCNCMWYPMGSLWAHKNPFVHMWFYSQYTLLLYWRSVSSQWSMPFHIILPLSKRNHEPWFVSLEAAICCILDIVDPHGRHYELPFRYWNTILDIIPHDQMVLFDHSILPFILL